MKRRSYKQIFLSLFIFLTAAMLSGCSSSAKRSQLEDMTRMYARALVGGDRTELLAFVHPSAHEKFLQNSEGLSELQFSGVEVRKIFPDEKLDSAIVLMSMEYYSQQDSSLMASVRAFNWSYDPQYKAWLLKDSSPFGVKQ